MKISCGQKSGRSDTKLSDGLCKSLPNNLNKWQRCFARRFQFPCRVNPNVGVPKRQLDSVKGS